MNDRDKIHEIRAPRIQVRVWLRKEMVRPPVKQ